jgi:hypothetical protein
MTSDKPTVLMLVMRGHKKSEKYARQSRKTWEDAGFKVSYVSAYTPETMPDFLDFSKKDKTNKTLAIQRRTKKKVVPYFSETEKAVWYSHLRIWRRIVKSKKPYIVAEHDAELVHTNFQWKEFCMRKLSFNLLGAVYLTPEFLERWFEYFDNKPDLNVDGQMAEFLKEYDRGELDVVFDKPLLHNYANDKDLSPWPVNASWAPSTIQHGLYNECVDDTDT